VETPDNQPKKEWLTKALGSINFAPEDKISDQSLDEEAVILLSGSNMFGDEIYTYVKVAFRNFRELREDMIAGKNIVPSDYGQVVAAGRGEPTQATKDEMRVTYNMVETPKFQPSNASKSGKPAGFSQPKFFADDE
jgi:hypothetical protein